MGTMSKNFTPSCVIKIPARHLYHTITKALAALHSCCTSIFEFLFLYQTTKKLDLFKAEFFIRFREWSLYIVLQHGILQQSLQEFEFQLL